MQHFFQIFFAVFSGFFRRETAVFRGLGDVSMHTDTGVWQSGGGLWLWVVQPAAGRGTPGRGGRPAKGCSAWVWAARPCFPVRGPRILLRFTYLKATTYQSSSKCAVCNVLHNPIIWPKCSYAKLTYFNSLTLTELWKNVSCMPVTITEALSAFVLRCLQLIFSRNLPFTVSVSSGFPFDAAI